MNSQTAGIYQRLSEVAAMLRSSSEPMDRDAAIEVERGYRELQRLDALINSPHTVEFLKAVELEALHQRERWAAEHDAGKSDPDWFWLIGYLAGKALHSGTQAKLDAEAGVDPTHHVGKRLHHIVTTAAACLNWHAGLTGNDTRMRPGIDPAKAA